MFVQEKKKKKQTVKTLRHGKLESSGGIQAVRCPGREARNENPEMYMELCWCEQLQRKATAKKNIKNRVGADGRWLSWVVLLLVCFAVLAVSDDRIPLAQARSVRQITVTYRKFGQVQNNDGTTGNIKAVLATFWSPVLSKNISI